QCADVLQNTRILPIDGADDLLGQAAIAVKDISFGKFERPVTCSESLVRVACDRERSMRLRQELFQRLSVLIHNYAVHRRSVWPHLLRKLLQAGCLLDTGRTPRGPEIHHDNVMAVLAEADER